MTTAFVPVSNAGATLTGGFVRYAGDDWDGANFLLFQYGTLVPAVLYPDGSVATPATITPIDITGFQPVGTLFLPRRSWRAGNIGVTYPLVPDLTVSAGTARVVTATQGLFGFCPRGDVTSQLPRVPEPPFGCPPDFACAGIRIAAKLIDTAMPGNLGTISRTPILVY